MVRIELIRHVVGRYRSVHLECGRQADGMQLLSVLYPYCTVVFFEGWWNHVEVTNDMVGRRVLTSSFGVVDHNLMACSYFSALFPYCTVVFLES